MAETNKANGPFHASFIYTEEILNDFAALYAKKREISPRARIISGLIGLAGAIYFGLELYHYGLSIARVGYLVGCSLLLLVAVSGGRSRGDNTVEKYRKHYLNRRAQFRIDEEGVYLKLDQQKNAALSKYKKIYGLCQTDLCFYFVSEGKSYYILPKKAVTGGTTEELASYMKRHCQKNFQFYQV